MPTSNSKQMPIWAVFFTLSSCLVVAVWASQNSINAYFEQTYHEDSPLTALNDYEIWQWGGELQTNLYQWRDEFTQWIDNENRYMVENFNKDYAFTQEYKDEVAKAEKLEKLKQQQEKLHNPPPTVEQNHENSAIAVATAQPLSKDIRLSAKDQVFFAGDSMMQGVAPHLQHRLQQRYGIKTVNLSKPSTGLAYTKFFDWVSTIKNTINQNPNIKLLIVFLGPNDLWDIPNPNTGKYVAFGSDEWANVYGGRIETIIKHAHAHKVQVIWLGPPTMQKPNLNKSMIWLNKVIADEVKNNQTLFIDTRPLLGGSDNVYKETLVYEGKNVKIRTTDGIHFTPTGQKIIAEEVWRHLNLE